MTDQQAIWNKAHTAGGLDHYANIPTSFAKEVQEIIPPNTYILELGCGAGNDAIFFAEQGHKILSTDFSEVAIEKNKKIYNNKNLTFSVMDCSKLMDFLEQTFDIIYTRLSLHYFTDAVTKNIFAELPRILKPLGYLCFLCKSINDPLYGKGQEIEKDMFNNNGRIRHFFSEEYTKEYLGDMFSIVKLESGQEKFYGEPSAFVKVIAQKK